MDRRQLEDRLTSKIMRHELCTVMLAVPRSEVDIDHEKLRDLLSRNKFPIHEIEEICAAAFN